MKYRRRFSKRNDGTILMEEAGTFTQRVSRQLYSLFNETKSRPIHGKTRKAGFKETWRVEHTSVPHLTEGADHVRGIRANMWWGGVRSYGSNRRILGVTKHRRRGPVSSWEQPLLCGMGVEWRQKRAMSDKRSWMDSCKTATKTSWRHGISDLLQPIKKEEEEEEEED